MMPVGPATRIYLAAGATDLRKSFEGLSDLVTCQRTVKRDHLGSKCGPFWMIQDFPP